MTTMPRVSQPVQVEVSSFEEAAAAVTADLQTALAALVAVLPGRNTRAVELQRTLRLDKKLGWQLFTFVSTPSPLDEVANVPGAPSMKRILVEARKSRAPRTVVGRAARAFEAFETFVAEHGGDRDEIVSLARGLSTDVDQAHELRVRKSVFRGLSHVWGVRARTFVRTAVIHPGRPGSDQAQDFLVVVGYVGLQRLWRGAPFALSATVGFQSNPAPGEAGPPALSEGPVVGPMEILREFSSQPLPEMASRVDPSGDVETELLFPPSGRPGAVTLFTAQHTSGAWAGLQSQHGLNTLVKIPAESYVCELLVPAGCTDPGSARVAIFGRRGAVERVHDLRAIDMLPQRETVTCTPGVAGPTALAGVPDHREAVGASLARLGWADVRYDLYRCVVEYPVLHTMIRIAADAARTP
jgi:hypothetical protein